MVESQGQMTLLDAVGIYVGKIKSKDNQDSAQKNLLRFVQWYGVERSLSEVKPPEIEEYAERVGGSGITPQSAAHLQAVKDFLSFVRKKGLVSGNLAIYVRIPKSKSLAGKASTQNAMELTLAGHKQLVVQLEKLKNQRGPLAEQIQKAAADRDVRENAPLEAAREQLGHVESRIMNLDNILKSAVITDPRKGRKSLKIKLGTRVSVELMSTGNKTQFTLVSRSEANPLEAMISDVSPLGKVLMGAVKGQEVIANTPRGKARYRVVRVFA